MLLWEGRRSRLGAFAWDFVPISQPLERPPFEARDRNGDPGWIRTSDLQLRRLLLYPLSYGAVGAKQLI